MIFPRSPFGLNASLFKFRTNSKIIRHGTNQYFSWCYLTPGQRLWRKYVNPKKYNGKISPRVSQANSVVSSCGVRTTSEHGRTESNCPYTYTVTNMKAQMNSQEYIIKKTVGTPKKAQLMSFISFDDEGCIQRRASSAKSYKFVPNRKISGTSNLDNQKILSKRKSQTMIESIDVNHNQKTTDFCSSFLPNEKYNAARNSKQKDTMIINPYKPDLRTIIFFKNKNIDIIEPSTNFDQINLANQHIMQLRKNLGDKPGRINFVRFDPSNVYINKPIDQFETNMDTLILKRVESISLEDPFPRYWVPIEKDISEYFPGNGEITLICYEGKNDTIVTNVPIKRNTLIEESVVTSKSILDIINSIDTSTVIIQKDLYITSRIIQSIKDEEKNKDKKKLDTQGSLEDLNQDLILHFTVKGKGKRSMHQLNPNIEGENLLYLPEEFSCSPSSFFELLKGIIRLNTHGFHLLKTNTDTGTAEFFFSLLGKADLKDSSPRDIIRRALGILEKEKFYQKKIHEEEKEKSKEDSLKSDVTDKLIKKEKQGKPEDKNLCSFPLEISGDILLGNSHILLTSFSLPGSNMPFELNFPGSTSPEERPQEMSSYPNDSESFEDDITNCNETEFISLRDFNFNNIYKNSNEIKSKVQVNDLIKAQYCINENCETHYIRPREIRPVYQYSNDLNWNIYDHDSIQRKTKNLEESNIVVQKHANKKEDKMSSSFNIVSETTQNKKQKYDSQQVWIDSNNIQTINNCTETNNIDLHKNTYKCHSNNKLDANFETEWNIENNNSANTNTIENYKMNRECVVQNINSNTFNNSFQNILKDKNYIKAKYCNNNNYKQTSASNIFEISSPEKTEDVFEKNNDYAFLQSKYFNYNNSGVQNSEVNIDREIYFLNTSDDSEFLEKSKKYNSIKDNYNDISKISNLEGLNNKEVVSENQFDDSNIVRDSIDYTHHHYTTEKNGSHISTNIDNIKDINMTEKADNLNSSETARTINDSMERKYNEIQSANICHDSIYTKEIKNIETQNKNMPALNPNDEPGRINGNTLSSGNTFGYTNYEGNNIKDTNPLLENYDNNSLFTDTENINEINPKNASDGIERNGRDNNTGAKDQNNVFEIVNTEKNVPDPCDIHYVGRKLLNHSLAQASDKVKGSPSFKPGTDENLSSSECAFLVDKSVMCLMSSHGKKGKEEGKEGKIHISGSDFIKDTQNSDHTKKTSINVTKNKHFTDINVSEKEVFTDPQIPMSFSTESSYQIIGSNSTIQNEMQAFEIAKGALISSLAENKNNTNLLKTNLKSPKIDNQALTDSLNTLRDNSHKSKAYTYRKKLNMRQSSRAGKSYKKQNFGKNYPSKVSLGKQMKAKRKETTGTFKTFVENKKKYQESDILGKKEKPKDELQLNIRNDSSINMSELDAKNEKSINNYVHLLEGTGKKLEQNANSSNSKKRKKVGLIEHKSLSKRDKIILREILKANKSKKKSIKPAKTKEELKSLYKELKNENSKVLNNMESLTKNVTQNSLSKEPKIKFDEPQFKVGYEEKKSTGAFTPAKSNQVLKPKSKTSDRYVDAKAKKPPKKLNTNTLKDTKKAPMQKEKKSITATSSLKLDSKQIKTSKETEKTKLLEKENEIDKKHTEKLFSDHKKEPKISMIEASKQIDNEKHTEVFKKNLLSKVESKIETNSQINFRVGSKKIAKSKLKMPKSRDPPTVRFESLESNYKLDKMPSNLKEHGKEEPYGRKVNASNSTLKNTKSTFKPLTESIPLQKNFTPNVKVSKPQKEISPSNKVGSKISLKQPDVKVESKVDEQISSKKKLEPSKASINVNQIQMDETNKNLKKIEKNEVQKPALVAKPEVTSSLPLKPTPSASEKAVKVEKTLAGAKTIDSDPKNVLDIPSLIPAPKEEKVLVPAKPKSIIKDNAFPKLLVDLDKMTKEIKPKFSYKTSRICSIPLDKIKNFPLWNPKKTKGIDHPTTVIKVCPSKDSKLSKELARIPPVTKILNVTLQKGTKDQMKTWWQTMTNKLGDKGFKNLYKGEMTSGTQFHNLIQDQLLWGNGGAIPSSPSFKSLQNVLKDIKDLCVINSHVVHSTLAYRGVVDCVAKYKKKPVIIEWKRMDKKENLEDGALESAFQQLTAYIGAMNYDSNYDFQVKGGLLVLAYNDGADADCFELNDTACENYWKLWLDRLQRYHIHVINKKNKTKL